MLKIYSLDNLWKIDNQVNWNLKKIPFFLSELETIHLNVYMSMLQARAYLNDRPEDEDYNSMYYRTAYADGEDGELSWFNAGVRVGVGIGLSVCLGIGIGVGLLVKTYQGTAGRFRRRPF